MIIGVASRIMSRMLADSTRSSASSASPQPRQDFFYWRLIGTALSFAVFGLGALTMGLIVLPMLKLIPASRERKRDRARGVMRRAMRFFVAQMRTVGVMTYDFQGADRLGRPGQLIIANHPSLIDVAFILGFTPCANCVVKRGLWRNGFTRSAVSLAQYIPNDPTSEMIASASEALAEGQTLIMFPEGTRTPLTGEIALHRGAANVALRAARVLTPVYIRCEPRTLMKGQPWYRIPHRRVHYTLVVGEDIDLAPYRSMAARPIASRALNDRLKRSFQQSTGPADPLGDALDVPDPKDAS
jgi:1-acyl-sn-glycerol-3-phosphate acyltransferase